MEGVGVYREFIGSAVDERLLSIIQGTVCATVNEFGVEDRSHGINHQTVTGFSSILFLKYAYLI